jgi:hypothetical protein
MHVVVLTQTNIDIVTFEAYEAEKIRLMRTNNRYVDIYAGLEEECHKWVSERKLNKYFESQIK